MTTFLTPLTTKMASDSSLGGIVVILLLIILIIEEEMAQLASKRERPLHWLTTMRVATLPLFFAFVLLMVSHLVLLVAR